MNVKTKRTDDYCKLHEVLKWIVCLSLYKHCILSLQKLFRAALGLPGVFLLSCQFNVSKTHNNAVIIIILKYNRSLSPQCWRNCGESNANYLHIFIHVNY